MPCPDEYCKDHIPEELTPYLKTLLAQLTREKLKHKPQQTLCLTTQICSAIEKIPKLEAHSAEKGWPKAVNFNSLSTQIVKMHKDIESVLMNEFVLENLVLWRKFIKNLRANNVPLESFSSLKSAQKYMIIGKIHFHTSL